MKKFVFSISSASFAIAFGVASTPAMATNCEAFYANDLALCNGDQMCEAIAADEYQSCLWMRELTGGFGGGT